MCQVESIPTAAEMAATLSSHVEHVASHLSEATDISASPSVPIEGPTYIIIGSIINFVTLVIYLVARAFRGG